MFSLFFIASACVAAAMALPRLFGPAALAARSFATSGLAARGLAFATAARRPAR